MTDQSFLKNVFHDKKFSKEEQEIIIPKFKRIEFFKKRISFRRR